MAERPATIPAWNAGPERLAYEMPECDCGCGAPCGNPEQIRDDGSWTHPNCDAEAWAERLSDARNDR